MHSDRIDLDVDRHQVHAILIDPELREPVAYSRDRHIGDSYVIKADASLRRAGQGMRMVVHDAPIAKAPSAALVNLIVKAFEIRDKILNGNGESVEAASDRIKINANYITAFLRISFLAPDIVEAVLDGRHPVTLTARNFSTKTHLLPRAWSLQRRHLGYWPLPGQLRRLFVGVVAATIIFGGYTHRFPRIQYQTPAARKALER